MFFADKQQIIKQKLAFCNENNVICLEAYYRRKQGKEGRVCVKP